MLHSHHASTLSSTEDPKMSKTRFFGLPNAFSIYFKHRIDTAQEASNCAFHKFPQKHTDAARELCVLRWTFLSQLHFSSLFLAERFHESKGKN